MNLELVYRYIKNTKQNKRTKKKRRKFPAARVVAGTIEV